MAVERRVGGRGGFFHAQAKAEARGQRKQEGECKYREEQLRGQTLSFLGSSREMSNDKIK